MVQWLRIHGQQIVGLSVSDHRRDGGVCRDGVDRDQSSLETVVFGEPLEQDRNAGGLIGQPNQNFGKPKTAVNPTSEPC
jgi:hypothetical protein